MAVLTTAVSRRLLNLAAAINIEQTSLAFVNKLDAPFEVWELAQICRGDTVSFVGDIHLTTENGRFQC